MADITRAEHLQWCKDRALAYLPGDPQGAFTSMCSDLNKHPETQGHIGMELGMMLMLGGHMNNPTQVRDFIEGFN